MERGYFPSVSVRVFSKDHTLLSASLGDTRPDTLFDVASLTKIATTAQALLLIEKGTLRLGDSITDCLPELSADSIINERLAGVTLEQLMTHTSGIVSWYPFYAESGDFTQVLRIVLSRYPREMGMVYSDINFMLLGKAVERAYGMPLEDCLKKLLVEPFGLGNMMYRPDPMLDIAPSCYGNPVEEGMCAERGLSFSNWRPHTPVRGGANDGNAYYYFSGIAGSAGIFADPMAYQRLCQFFMTTDSRLFQASQAARAGGRGLGWELGDMYPDGCGHTGFTGTSVYLSRNLNIGAVIFTNRLFYPKVTAPTLNGFRRELHQIIASVNG